MKASVWLGIASVATSILAFGCTSSGKKSTPQYDNSSKAVAQALTTGLDFDKGKLLAGALPETTAESVAVTPDSETVTLKPAGTAIMSLEVDNPDEAKDPVAATLMQFEDTDQHVEIPRDKGDGGGIDQNGKITLDNKFKVDTAICKDFCNKSFDITLQMAVKLDSGKISQHAERSFTLDCTKDGDKNKCGEPDAGKKSGTGGKTSTKPDAGKGTAGSGVDNSLGEKVALQVIAFNKAVCGCNGGTAASYCDGQGYTATTVACVKKAVNDNLDSSMKNAKATCDIMAISNYVAKCQPSCTTCTYQGFGDALRNEATAACRMMPNIPGFDACMLMLGDAGMPKDAGGPDAGIKDSGAKP